MIVLEGVVFTRVSSVCRLALWFAFVLNNSEQRVRSRILEVFVKGQTAFRVIGDVRLEEVCFLVVKF